MNLRLTLAAAIALGLSLLPTLAAEPEATLQELAKCSAIPDGPARLSCYDGVMPRVRAALAAGPEQLSRDDQSTLFGLDFSGWFGSSGGTTPEGFGQDNLRQAEPPRVKPLESISAGVTDYSFTPRGKFIVFLDNGQVWRQQESDNVTANFRGNPTANKVEISKGMMGAYNLTINGLNQVFRVKRIK